MLAQCSANVRGIVRFSVFALVGVSSGCGTWQHNGVPAEVLASPRVIERDLGPDAEPATGGDARSTR